MGVTFNARSSVADEEATMEFFDDAGNQVSAGNDKAVVQYLSNDPNRPEPKRAKTGPDETKAKTGPDKSTETK